MCAAVLYVRTLCTASGTVRWEMFTINPSFDEVLPLRNQFTLFDGMGGKNTSLGKITDFGDLHSQIRAHEKPFQENHLDSLLPPPRPPELSP